MDAIIVLAGLSCTIVLLYWYYSRYRKKDFEKEPEWFYSIFVVGSISIPSRFMKNEALFRVYFVIIAIALAIIFTVYQIEAYKIKKEKKLLIELFILDIILLSPLVWALIELLK